MKSMKNIDHLSGPTFSGELYHHKKMTTHNILSKPIYIFKRK